VRYLYLYILLVSCYLLPATCNAQIITTVAGTGTQGYSGDGGQATNAAFYYPYGVAFDIAGNLYIADGENNCIRKINTSGVVTTIVGNGTGGYGGDGGQATAAQLYQPISITIDNAGNLYIADDLNSRIRKVNTSGIITTIAGTGTQGYSGDNGQATAAMINTPVGLAFDAMGNLFITEEEGYRIRKVNTNGIITTIAGTGTAGYSGDNGFATSAQLNTPIEITFDNKDNLYFADETNNRIRKINTAGTITTIAGIGTQGYSGDGGTATLAQLNNPFGIVTDVAGNIYFSESWNNIVRKVDTLGIITTIAGTGAGASNGGSCTSMYYSGDGGLATLAELNEPGGITLDIVGNLYITDLCNNRIRKVTNVTTLGIEQFTNNRQEVNIYPNPITTILNVECLRVNTNSTLVITDMLGNNIKQIPFNIQQVMLNIGDIADGIYFVTIETERGKTIKKIIKQ